MRLLQREGANGAKYFIPQKPILVSQHRRLYACVTRSFLIYHSQYMVFQIEGQYNNTLVYKTPASKYIIILYSLVVDKLLKKS